MIENKKLLVHNDLLRPLGEQNSGQERSTVSSSNEGARDPKHNRHIERNGGAERRSVVAHFLHALLFYPTQRSEMLFALARSSRLRSDGKTPSVLRSNRRVNLSLQVPHFSLLTFHFSLPRVLPDLLTEI